ncbi:MAG TPA: hypothetical protein VGP93_13025, partial [Polyangiaceae bacterium]|nr:hypothetical protein [Polyangiaceae bacterium]
FLDEHKISWAKPGTKPVVPPPVAPPATAPGAPTVPPALPPANDAAKQEPAVKARAHRGELASGFLAAKASGFLNGQLYADQVVDEATAQGIETVGITTEAILEELDAARDYDDLRDRLRKRYATLDPAALSQLTYRAMVMVELGGRAAVNEDA